MSHQSQSPSDPESGLEPLIRICTKLAILEFYLFTMTMTIHQLRTPQTYLRLLEFRKATGTKELTLMWLRGGEREGAILAARESRFSGITGPLRVTDHVTAVF
jgi:hypothetical protein